MLRHDTLIFGVHHIPISYFVRQQAVLLFDLHRVTYCKIYKDIGELIMLQFQISYMQLQCNSPVQFFTFKKLLIEGQIYASLNI